MVYAALPVVAAARRVRGGGFELIVAVEQARADANGRHAARAEREVKTMAGNLAVEQRLGSPAWRRVDLQHPQVRLRAMSRRSRTRSSPSCARCESRGRGRPRIRR
jgi:hypothetical protein